MGVLWGVLWGYPNSWLVYKAGIKMDEDWGYPCDSGKLKYNSYKWIYIMGFEPPCYVSSFIFTEPRTSPLLDVYCNKNNLVHLLVNQLSRRLGGAL